MDIKVSVIIPVYNTEKYIEKCLESVICQTLSDIEVICVDDVSEDSSSGVIKKYIEQDNRIRYFRNQKNEGLSFCRNLGISKARGKYIQFLDSDDFLMPDALESLWTAAEKNQLDVLVTDHETKFEVADKVDAARFDERLCGKVMDGKSMFIRESVYDSIVVTAWSHFVKLDFLIKNTITFYEGIYHEDHLYSYYLRLYAKRIMAVNKKTYVYRIREHSIMTSVVDIRHIKGMLRTILEIKKENIERNNSKFAEATDAYISILTDILYQMNMCNENCTDLSQLDTEEQQLLWNIIDKKIYYHFRKAYFGIGKKKPEKIIVYGAGRVAKTVIYLLEEKGIEIDKVAVSDVTANGKMLYGYEIYQIDELAGDKKDALVLIAVQKENSDMLDRVKDLGFEQIVPLW